MTQPDQHLRHLLDMAEWMRLINMPIYEAAIRWAIARAERLAIIEERMKFERQKP